MKRLLLVLISICSLGPLSACEGSGSITHLTMATHLWVTSASSTSTSGTAFNFIVTALDASNNVVTSYAGTVHFTNSDSNAIRPPNSALTSGKRTFSATLKPSSAETMATTDMVRL